KTFACIGCFRCTHHVCPKDLNPMVINEIIKWAYHTSGFDVPQYIDPMNPKSRQRILSSIQVSKENYDWISNERIIENADVVFFPGCNIYYQPDKLLAALEVLNEVNENYSFIPGLDYCCGNIQMLNGDLDNGEKAYRGLINRLRELKPKKVVFWCSSCIVRILEIIADYEDFNFEILSVSQYLTQNKDKLNFKHAIHKNLVVHDPCKVLYTEIDPIGPRELLKSIEGVSVIDKNTDTKDELCCGISSPFMVTERMKNLQDKCLNEVVNMDVHALVDVCHACHNFFLNQAEEVDFDMDSYILMIAQALGLEHQDFFKEIKKCKSLDEIKSLTKDYYSASPYTEQEIDAEIKNFFGV
ncbi:MAG: (Fe-S)-binding protein, partial [Clostridia bacterium]|nr:(Fe-S)-binding protein [Clostridia bacterium]